MFPAAARLLASALPPRLRVVPRHPPAPDAGRPAGRPPRGGRALRRGFAALRHPNYRYYWSGQVVSLIGTWMQSVSQPWLVLLLGGTPVQLGTVLALQFLPATLLAPLGGVMADRIDKRKALMVAQAVAMLEATTLFTLTVTNVVEIWHIMLLALLLGMVNAVEMPMRQAFAAELVPREDLMNAIALNSASFNAARVVGPAMAGVTLALFGPAFNFAINAVSYLAVLFGLSRIDPSGLHRVERPEHPASVRSSLSEGFRYAARTPMVLWPLVLLGGMATFGMNFQTLLPLFARGTLGMGAAGYGALFAAMGVGSLAGSLSLAFAGSQRPLLRLILGGGLMFVIFELGLGLARVPLAAYPLVILLGLSSMLMVNTINVTIQNAVSNELRGRVMSLYVTVFAGSAPIGGFLAGWVAQLWGPPAGFLLGASLASVVLALVAWQLLLRGKAWTDEAVAPQAVPITAGAADVPRAAGE
ncbi:MAG TPA: MFS transporter [candidate division Zixibacteria bacterium]|nr:MFS transporter [candidate division Zixibacteria bacterium]